jgi:hypothetical protein
MAELAEFVMESAPLLQSSGDGGEQMFWIRRLT